MADSTTPSGGIETAADNAGAIAITWVVVTGAIAVSRLAVAGSAIAITWVAVTGAIPL